MGNLLVTPYAIYPIDSSSNTATVEDDHSDAPADGDKEE
jgi:hypothetical protein